MKKIIYIVILSITTGNIFSQNTSLYTREGIGDNQYSSSARRLGLGGMGLALIDETHISSINPAGWANVNLTRMEAGLNYGGVLMSDINGSAYYSNFSFSGFTVGIPIHKDYGIVGALGVVPVSDVNYKVTSENLDAICSDCSDIEDDFNSVLFEGTGGLSKIFIGSSYKLPFGFIIGASFNYYTGKIDYKTELQFNEFSSLDNVMYTQKRSFYGIGSSFGLITDDLASIFDSKSIENFRFAFYYDVVSNLKTDTSLISSTSIGTITKNKGIVDSKIPYKIGIGAGLTWNKNYVILFDYLYQPWSEYEFNNLPGSLRDLSRASVSVEYYNSDRRTSANIWDMLVLRGGISYENSQYLIGNTGINVLSLYLGFSMPIGVGNTLDFAFEYGNRGKKREGLVKEDIFKAAVSISFGELWFFRPDR
ncbi:MAG: hypothetical protein JW995_00380 [Melioribacteraceae bacterium]|nr:hypothetical protein [Melioribacteraceae bacterium]